MRLVTIKLNWKNKKILPTKNKSQNNLRIKHVFFYSRLILVNAQYSIVVINYTSHLETRNTMHSMFAGISINALLMLLIKN